MAEYVMYHTETAREVHMLVGAAHQPGIVYYLEQFRDGKRRLGEFVPCE
jgi:pheromone shutdown protein TraB